MSENKSSSSGIGILGLLGVVFVTLKLCGVIGWSWWLVTAPFWAIPTILFSFAGICLVLAKVIK